MGDGKALSGNISPAHKWGSMLERLQMKTYKVRLENKTGIKHKTVQAYSISHAIAEAVRGEGNVIAVVADLI